MTMALLSVIKDVCATVGVTIPSSVFSNITGNRTMQEMLSLANEMAQRIAYDNRDWTALKRTNTIVGDGVSTAFDLPADYQRMLLTSNVWRSTSTQSPMRFIPDTDEWLNRRADEVTDTAAWGEWTMLGGQIHIWPVLEVDQSAYFAYLHRNCIALASGGFGDVFMADGDRPVLNERVLKLGMIWQWKAQKGAPYAEDMGTYGDALTYAMGHDSPGPIIIGRRPISANARYAYPFDAPTGYIT
jgi:hypothetical protein